MPTKMHDTIEGAIALFAFVGIVGISVISVIALNPRTTPVVDTKVAGLQNDESEVLEKEALLPITVADINRNSVEYSTTLTYDQTQKIYDYTAQVDPTTDTLRTYGFTTIKNPNSVSAKVELRTSIEGDVGTILKVRLLDGVDKILLYEPNSLPTFSNIIIPPLGEKKLELEYELSERVNFPFQVNFVLY